MRSIAKKTYYIWIFVFALILVNGYFIFQFSNKNTVTKDIWTLFQRWSYQVLANDFDDTVLSSDDEYYRLVSMAKLWDYDWVWIDLQEQKILDKRLEKLYKVFSFYDKGDWEWIINYVWKMDWDSSQVRSFNLQMRAYAYLKLWKYEEATILANDSVVLDEFSPWGMILLGIIQSNKRNWSESLKNFERWSNLWHIENDLSLFHRWTTEFYLKRRSEMENHFDLISDNSLYAYDIAVFKWRNYFENQKYKEASLAFNKAEKINGKWWIHMMWLWKVYMNLEQWSKAYEVQQIARERSWWNPNPELLSDMIIPLSKLWEDDELKLNEVLIEERLSKSPWRHEIYVRALQKASLHDKSYAVWSKAIDTLFSVNWANLEKIHNLNLRTIIYKLLETKWTPEEAKRYDLLINYQGATTKERYVYLSLRDYWAGDAEIALRALQELQTNSTEEDLQTIQILHLIFNNEAKKALEKLQEYSEDPQYDIDYQRLKWKTLSLLQDWAEDYREETQEQLKLLSQLTNDEISTDEAFERRFNKRLKYMKHFYK